MGGGASTPRSTWHLAQASEDVAIRAFEELDTDHSQSLTFKEIRAGVAQRGAAIRADWPDELIAKIIRMYDQDKDGALSREEFCAALRDMEERKPPKPSMAKQLFDVIDADGNGKIDRTEACKIAEALECSSESFWNILLRYSKASPGKVIYPEFIKALQGKLFVEFFRTSGYKVSDLEDLCHKALEKLSADPNMAHQMEPRVEYHRSWSFKKETISEEEKIHSEIDKVSVADAMKDAVARREAKAKAEAEAKAKAEAEAKAAEMAEPSVVKRAKKAAKIKASMEADGEIAKRIQQKLKEAEKAIADKLKQRAKDAEEAKAAEAARLAAEEAVREEQKRKADAWIAEERRKRGTVPNPAAEARAKEEAMRAEAEAAEARRLQKLADAAAETAANHAAEDKLKLKSRLGDIDPDYKAPAPRLKM